MSEFGSDQKRELQRLIIAMRRLIEASVQLPAPLATLTQLADGVEELAEVADQAKGGRPFPPWSAPAEGDFNTILPWSPVSGRFHPCAPPVELVFEQGRATGTATLGMAYEGPPANVHGSMIAAIYDQVLAFAALASGTPGHTAFLTTTYKQLTPLHTELRFEGWVDRVEDRKVYTLGTCHADGELVTEAEALFIRMT